MCLTAFIALVHPDLIAKLVNVTVPSQVDQEPASHVLDSPEIEGSKDDHDDESEDFFVQESIQEQEAED